MKICFCSISPAPSQSCTANQVARNFLNNEVSLKKSLSKHCRTLVWRTVFVTHSPTNFSEFAFAKRDWNEYQSKYCVIIFLSSRGYECFTYFKSNEIFDFFYFVIDSEEILTLQEFNFLNLWIFVLIQLKNWKLLANR